MYRKSIMQEQEKIAQEQFLTRLGNIPVVSTAWTHAWGLYQKTKDSNTLIHKTLDLAENSIKTVAETTKPVVEKYQPHIEVVNNFACKQLDKLEEKYPSINKQTDELVEDGKTLIKPALDRVEAVKQYGTDTIQKGKDQVENVKQMGTNVVSGAKDYGMQTIGMAMDTSYGHFVSEKLNSALTLSEDYLDKYLPGEDEEEEEEEDDDDDDSDSKKGEMDEYPPNPVVRARDLTTKLRRRMYKRALRDLRSIHVRSQESLAQLSFTVDLIEYAKTNMGGAKDTVTGKMEEAQTKMSTLWTEITSEDGDEEEMPNTLEGRSIVVARRLTHQIRQGVTTINSYLPEKLQPSALRDRLQQTYKYSEDLYQYFKDVAKYEDVPSWMLIQAKDRLSYLQTALTFMAETFVTVPLNWLAPDVDLQNLAIEDPVIDLNSNGHIPNIVLDEHGRYVQGDPGEEPANN